MAHDEQQAAFDAIIEAWGDEEVLTPERMQEKRKTLIVLDESPEGDFMETARDDSFSWWVQDWERYDMAGQWYWRAGDGYRLDKSVVTRLAQAQTQGLMSTEPPSAPGSFQEARGCLPVEPQQPKPEDIIRKMRDAL